MRIWWIAAPLVVVGAGAVGLWAHHRAVQASAPPGLAQETAAVKRGNIVSTMTATGTVEAWNETVVRVGVGVSGTLQPFNWNIAQTVGQGQVLFTLVNPQLVQQTASDESSYQEAQLQLQQMQAAAADRAPQQAAQDNAQLALEQAQYAYGQAEANLQTAQQVVAPVSGTVATLDAAVGQDVTNGGAVVSIVETSTLLAQVQVPQGSLGGIARGEPALVDVNGGSYPGQVEGVGQAPSADYKGVPLYPVSISLANPGGLLPGMPVTASIQISGSPPSWSVGLVGTLTPVAAVNADAQAAGTVASLAVQVGQTVQAGQVLGQIQAPALADAVTADMQNLRQAQAAVASLQANQAANALAVPYNIQQQELKVENLQAAVARDHTLEAGLTVVSPVSGVISGVQAVAGEPVSAGTPLLTIGDYHRLLVSFPLDQLYVDQVRVGQTAAVTATAAPGQTFTGSVYLVAPEGTDVGGVSTFQAEVEIPRPTPQLRPGMAVNVSIVLGQAKGVLTVPLQALHTGGSGGTFVVVVTRNAAGVVSTRDVPVTVGLQDTLDAQVSGKLSAGAQVLTGSLGTLSSTTGLNVRGRVVKRKVAVTHRAPANTRK